MFIHNTGNEEADVTVLLGKTVTKVVTFTAGQLPFAAIVYKTVYTPGVLVFGVIAPVVGFNVNPDVEIKTPPK